MQVGIIIPTERPNLPSKLFRMTRGPTSMAKERN